MSASVLPGISTHTSCYLCPSKVIEEIVGQRYPTMMYAGAFLARHHPALLTIIIIDYVCVVRGTDSESVTIHEPGRR
jgi:hypothetical protein